MSCYDIDTLRKGVLAGEKYQFHFFWRPTAEGGCLSQWWMGRFTTDGVEYNCAEQYMMAEKARLFGDGEMLEAILGTDDPRAMRAYGRKVQGFDAKVWGESCYGIVLRGNLAKFGQDEALRAYLLGTGERILVEASPWDRVWGIGMGASNAAAEDPLKWRGKNLLGFVLTEVRDRLRLEEQGAL